MPDENHAHSTRIFNLYKALGTNFLSWAMSVAHFEVLKFRKKRRKDHLHLADEIVESIAQEAISNSDEMEDILEILRTCLSRLKQPDQKVIQLRYYKSKTIKEVARYIGKSAESLYKAMARIHHNLLKCVQRNSAR